MIQITGPRIERGDDILTPEAIAFVDHLHQAFAARYDSNLLGGIPNALHETT